MTEDFFVRHPEGDAMLSAASVNELVDRLRQNRDWPLGVYKIIGPPLPRAPLGTEESCYGFVVRKAVHQAALPYQESGRAAPLSD